MLLEGRNGNHVPHECIPVPKHPPPDSSSKGMLPDPDDRWEAVFAHILHEDRHVDLHPHATLSPMRQIEAHKACGRANKSGELKCSCRVSQQRMHCD